MFDKVAVEHKIDFAGPCISSRVFVRNKSEKLLGRAVLVQSLKLLKSICDNFQGNAGAIPDWRNNGREVGADD
jgi:hypothetical protein